MPVSPDHGARLAWQVVDVIAEAEISLLRQIASRLAAGAEASEWAQAKLAELQMIRARLVHELAEMDATLAAQVNETMRQAYTTGQAMAVADLDAAGITPALPPAQMLAVQAIAADVITRVTGLAPRVLRSVSDVYQQAVAAGVGNVLLGVQTRLQAAQGVLDRLLADGITGFTDTAGRNWRLESYVEMATRTGAGDAAIAGHLDTLAASGQDLIYPIPGPFACPDCDQWAGRPLSISGVTSHVIAAGRRIDVTPVATARADGHLFGPNCRCSTGIYLPGITVPNVDRSSPADYETTQEQRYLERGVRHWKRREALALDEPAARRAKGKTRQWQARLRAHLDAHPDLNRKRQREQIRRAI